MKLASSRGAKPRLRGDRLVRGDSRLPTPRWLTPLAWIGGGALALWLAFGHGFVQYDTFYALLWGSEIAEGMAPDFDAALAPTPHPLATLAGVLLAPLGDGAEEVTLGIAFVSLAAVAYLTYRLGAEWFNPAVGALAAAIMVTRQPLLDFGVRAYVDIPYLALVLGALLIETRRPRAGGPVLALLALAGLLRPEAWLFSAAYVIYLAYFGDDRRPAGALSPLLRFLRHRPGLLALAAAGPLLWAAYDLAVAGDPLYSLTGTQETVEALRRDTGLDGLVVEGPQRLGEVLREPVLIGAPLGLALCLALLRRHSLTGVVALLLALAAFAVLALAGLAVLTRYLLLAATLLAIFCAAGALGWLSLERESPWRRTWAFAGALILVLLLAFVPAQADRLADLEDSIAVQERIGDDLRELADSGAFESGCKPVTVPSARPIPFLALWLDRRPSDIVSAGGETAAEPSSGYLIEPATSEVEGVFRLDPNEPAAAIPLVPRGFELTFSNESWDLYASCP
jgi:hypothetical protein